jgi:predicted AAA+ superfamily ATPase
MEFKRVLKLTDLLQKNSFFLFGPRATGKSYLIRKTLGGAQLFNLLDDDVYESLLRRPTLLREEIQTPLANESPIVVIDEIQKLPKLLSEEAGNSIMAILILVMLLSISLSMK